MQGTVLSSIGNITLITIRGFPANLSSITDILSSISALGVNIDMISMAPTQGTYTGLSFTVSDNDLISVLEYTSTLKKNDILRVTVSSENHKISVFNEAMRNTPGIAAKVFQIISKTDADIRLITTSEVEISFLVPESDVDNVYEALEAGVQ